MNKENNKVEIILKYERYFWVCVQIILFGWKTSLQRWPIMCLPISFIVLQLMLFKRSEKSALTLAADRSFARLLTVSIITLETIIN